MKILILGVGGMAGHILYDKFSNDFNFETFGAARSKINKNIFLFDAFDEESLKIVLDKCNPDIVINAVGMLVKAANSNPSNAILINSYFPHLLSEFNKERGIYTIHLSTDCVFSGHKNKGSYKVNDFKDAVDFYGKTKALGELNNQNDLTIRTSIIGPEIKNDGTGLLDWYLKSSMKVSGYNKVYWSGITTLELFNVIIRCVGLKQKGLVQISNNNKISKHELLRLIGRSFNKNIELIEKDEIVEHDKSLISSMPIEKYEVPQYEKMIEDLSAYMLTNKTKYQINYPMIY